VVPSARHSRLHMSSSSSSSSSSFSSASSSAGSASAAATTPSAAPAAGAGAAAAATTTTTTAAAAPPTVGLQGLEAALEKSIHTLWMTGLLLEDMGAPHHAHQLQKHIAEFEDDLRLVDEQALALHARDLRVPVAVIEAVDEGGNPDAVLRSELLATKSKNDQLRSKLTATTLLHNHLQGRMRYWEQYQQQQQQQQPQPQPPFG